MDPPSTTTTTTATLPTPTLTPISVGPLPTPPPTQPQESATPSTTTTAPHPQTPLPSKLRLMCSYNGQIISRPNTKQLCYLGGDTRMISLDRDTSISDLLTRIALSINTATPFSVKYQLPGEDLDSLISLSTDEDLDNMVDEYDRLNSISAPKPARIRLFLFPLSSQSQSQSQSPGMIDGSDDWFLNAINGTGYSDPGTAGTGKKTREVDCLIGLDVQSSDNVVEKVVVVGHDVQSVPDSKTSSFGSTSGTLTTILGNEGCLPMIKVHADGNRNWNEGGNGNGNGGGIEEQFGQMNMSNSNGIEGQVQKMVVVDGNLGRIDSSSQPIVNGFSGGEFVNRVYSEDVKQQQPQQQLGVKPQLGTDLPSPDSISSDNSLAGANSRQKPVVYQDPNGQLSSGSTSVPFCTQGNQVSESGYLVHPQYDAHQQIVFQPHQQQLPQQQNFLQQQPQTQPQTQQQYIPAGPHFVNHLPPGAVPMPMPAYYPVYPSQQPSHHPHHYVVYYVPAPGYSLLGQQQPNPAEAPTSIPFTRTQLVPHNPTIVATTTTTYNPPGSMNMEPPKSEMGLEPGTLQLVQAPSNRNQPSSQSQPQPQLQCQFVGYSQVHHPSQTVAPSLGPVPKYSYEYYTQPQTPVVGSQYEGVVSTGPTMMMREVSSHLSNDSVKQQPRSSQPL